MNKYVKRILIVAFIIALLIIIFPVTAAKKIEQIMGKNNGGASDPAVGVVEKVQNTAIAVALLLVTVLAFPIIAAVSFVGAIVFSVFTISIAGYMVYTSFRKRQQSVGTFGKTMMVPNPGSSSTESITNKADVKWSGVTQEAPQGTVIKSPPRPKGTETVAVN
jgi:hypothetical protein